MKLTKKAAMFGLEAGALRKQSGGLFLASLRRLTFRLVAGQQATKVKTQSGAMFGLDARIALAIFGALSVISGAALYSAIKEARLVQTITQFTEINKAIESYLLDTREDLPFVSPGQVKSLNLVTNDEGVRGWDGPYVNFPANGDYELKNVPVGSYNHAFVKKAMATNWAEPAVATDCDGTEPCYYWTEINCFDQATVEALDIKVDGSVGNQVGKFRYANCSSSGFKPFFRGPLTLGQP